MAKKASSMSKPSKKTMPTMRRKGKREGHPTKNLHLKRSDLNAHGSLSIGSMILTSNDGDDVRGGFADDVRNEAYFRFHLERTGVCLLPDTPLGLWALDDSASSHSRTGGLGASCPQHVLMKLAIWGSPEKRLTSDEIIDAVTNRFPHNELDALCPMWKASFRYARSGDPLMVRRTRNRMKGEKDRGEHWTLDYRAALRAAAYKFGLPVPDVQVALHSHQGGQEKQNAASPSQAQDPSLTDIDSDNSDGNWECWMTPNSFPSPMYHCLDANPNCVGDGKCFCGTVYFGSNSPGSFP